MLRQSQAPAGSVSRAPTLPGDPRTSGSRGRSRAAATVYVVGVVVTFAALGWAGWRVLSRNIIPDVGPASHLVDKQSFSVVLKEKGELKAAESTDIKSEVEGRCTIISLVAEGTAVKEGDLLVRLASNEIEDKIQSEELRLAAALSAFEAAKTELDLQIDKNASDIRKAELKLELAQLELDKYEKGDWAEAMKDANVEIDRATITLRRAEEDLKASVQLYERQYITSTKHEEDKFNHQKAQWDLDKANRALEVLVKYTHTTDQRQKESDRDEALQELERTKKSAQAEEARKRSALEGKEKELDLTRSKLTKLQEQRDKCEIKATGAGLVVYFTEGYMFGGDDQIKEGATVFERQTILTLVNTMRMKVAAKIHESKTNKVMVGQPASVTVEGVPGRVFTGKVAKIGVLAQSQNRWMNPDLKEYEVEIELDETDHPLKPGVTAVAEILVDRVESVAAVPVQSIFSRNGHNFVFKVDGRAIEVAEVEPGISSSQWVEIKKGVETGQQVMLAVNDEQLRMLPDLPPVQVAPPMTPFQPPTPQPGQPQTMTRGQMPPGVQGRPGGGPGAGGGNWSRSAQGRPGGHAAADAEKAKSTDGTTTEAKPAESTATEAKSTESTSAEGTATSGAATPGTPTAGTPTPGSPATTSSSRG